MSRETLLIFQIGPVQDFIVQARKTQDLWAGSWLLSRLICEGLLAVTDKKLAGSIRDEDILYPALSQQPLVRYLRGETPLNKPPSGLLTPNLPNRFLARVPDEAQARKLGERAATAIRTVWKEIADCVRRAIHKQMGAEYQDWATGWEAQAASFPVVDWLVHTCTGEFAEGVPPLDHEPASSFARECALADWKFAALKSSRGFLPWQGAEVPKDVLDGKSEVMGGDHHEEFWDALRRKCDILLGFRRDRKSKQTYGAITLIKRAFPEAWLREELKWPLYKPRFLSTEDIAAEPPGDVFSAAERKAAARLDHAVNMTGADDEPEDSSKKNTNYYAIIAMDGDDMGKWVSGSMTSTDPALNPVHPEYHTAFSARLSDFALRKVPQVIRKHGGRLIYAGGDDVLAMLPAASGLPCAQDLAALFAETVPGATASAGIAIGHVHSPLQDTLTAAREAERLAKAIDEDKGGWCLSVLKRSSDSVQTRGKWTSPSSGTDSAGEGDVVGLWTLLNDGFADQSALALQYARLVRTQLQSAGPAKDQCWLPAWPGGANMSHPLREVCRRTLAQVLRRQGDLAGRPADSAADGSPTDLADQRATSWMNMLKALPPRDHYHFWTAWAFLQRSDTGEETTENSEKETSTA